MAWNSTNSTTLVKVTGPTWTFLPTVYTVVAILAVLDNGFVLLALLTHKVLRTPFNIYLMNLVAANLLYTTIQTPADIINNLYSGWWLGPTYCNFFLYASYIFGAGIRVCHLLITINRAWAVLWPHSYWTSHKKFTAAWMCLSGWLYVHAVVIPGLIRDALYYRLPLQSNRCFSEKSTQYTWALIVQFGVYNMPAFFMLLVYPLIWCKRRESRLRLRNLKSVAKQEVTWKQPATGMARGSRTSSRPRRSSHGFTILTMLTVSVLVCWLPAISFYTVKIWRLVDNEALNTVVTMLLSMQSVVDPLLFVAALPDLRQPLIRFLTVRQRIWFI